MSAAIRRNADGRAYVRVSARVADVIAGDSDLSQWDDEELLRGQQRDKDGSFRGRKPVLVPRELYAEFARRQMESGFADMMGDLREIVGAVRHIAMDPDVDENTRLRAAEMVMDRIYGKPKQAVDVSVGEVPKHEQFIQAVTIQRDLPDEDDVIDAEVVDEEPNWETELDEWED